MSECLISIRLVLLAAIPTLFLFAACDSTTGQEAPTLRAGAAKTNLDPKPGVSLDGPISKNGPVTSIHDSLHARALVLESGDTTLAIVICDACMIDREVFDAAKRLVQQSIGIRFDHLLMAATHTHAAPRLIHVGTSEADNAYHRWATERIAESVIAAYQNLAPAEIGYASFEEPDLIACRRFVCEPGSVGLNPFGEAGERIKSVAGKSSQIIEPAGPIDPTFSILAVRHTDGSPLAILGNFSVHYVGGYKRGSVSADYFGHYCTALEQSLESSDRHPPVVALMSNGTSGNTGSIQSGGKPNQPFELMQVAARSFARKTLESIDGLEYESRPFVRFSQSELQFAVRKPSETRLAWAQKIKQTQSQAYPHRWSGVYADEAIHLSSYPDHVSLILQAISIGDIGIAAMPSEVFAQTGLAIKRGSPFAATINIELANGYGGYLPTPEDHEMGGYETWPARSSFLETEAEPRIRLEALRLLKEVHVRN